MSAPCADDATLSRPEAGTREWLGLALLALPTLLLGLDLTLLHLAMPALSADLRPTATEALWIMDAYGFMIAGFLVTMGTLGDRIGRRRLLMVGAAAFAAASVLAAFAPTAATLIAARAALGVAAATLMPSTLALISNLFAVPRQRALAIGIWATTFALGMAAGPVVGGLLVERFWWGAAFLAAVPVVALLLLLAPVLLPEYRAPRAGRLDLASVALSLLALLPAVATIKGMAKDGPSLAVAGMLLAGLGFGLLFVRRQRRLADPLLDLALFRDRAFAAALVVMLFGLVTVAGAMLLVAQYLQLVAGFSPLRAGLWMGPPALAMVAAGIGAPLLARRIRPGFVVAGALLLSVPGYGMLAALGTDTPGLAVAGFALAYLGLGTLAALGTELVVGAAAPEKAGSAAALSETVQDLGASLGIALLGSLAAALYRHGMAGQVPEALPPAVRAAVGDSLWAALAVAPAPPPTLLAEARDAFVAGVQGAAVLSAGLIAILALLAALALRHVGVTADPVQGVRLPDP